nr:retrotransposon protein, putative, Ty3-gypsy subclass [Tanacetum cinerariifolium]
KGKPNGKLLVDSVLNGPFQYGTIIEPRTETTAVMVRARPYTDLTYEEKLRESVDITTKNIVLQGTKEQFKMEESLFRLFKGDRHRDMLTIRKGTLLQIQVLTDKGLEFKIGWLSVTTIKRKTADLDTFNFDCDDVPLAKAILMANLYFYDSGVLLEELLVYVNEICPSTKPVSNKLVAVTPMNKTRKVRFEESNDITIDKTQKQVQPQEEPTPNNSMSPSIRVSSSTEASGSKLMSNTKRDRISKNLCSDKKKNKVEAHLRISKSRLNNTNHVFKTVFNDNVKHSVLNVNSELICATCHEFMFDAIHDLCVSVYLNDVNAHIKSKSVKSRFAKSKKKEMWKPTGIVYTKRRVKDLQLGVKSYQKRLNITKPDTYWSDLKRREAYTAHSNPRGFIYQNKDKKNRLMRIDELHKFSDGTLNDVRNALDDHLKGIRMQYLPQTIWRKADKDRTAAMIKAINKMLKTMRIMRSLESGQQGYWASLRIEPDLISRIKEAQKEDSEIGTIVENIDKQVEFRIDDDNVLWKDTRLVVPNDVSLREALLTEAHSSPFSVHPGSTKMYHDLKQYFWWSGMKRDVARNPLNGPGQPKLALAQQSLLKSPTRKLI